MFEAVFVIFGASGDLAKRSLVPALYRLFARGKLKDFVIFGAAIDDKPAQEVLDGALEFIKDLDKELWQEFSEKYFYQKLDFRNLDDYKSFGQLVNSKSGGIQNRLLYCSAGAAFFEDITINSVQAGLIKRGAHKESWQRIAYEKPFGYSLQSAEQINKVIAQELDEEQVFRVDHFLGKELLENVSYIRFTNTLLKSAWNKECVESVDVCLEETISIFDRGGFYDKVGALVDVIQNHVLQMFALAAMEAPSSLTPEAITKAKINVLKQVKFVDGVLGQYEGYKKEKFVDPNSTTDTYALLKVEVDNERWKGVPFYLKTGKTLPKKYIAIKINFKKAECLLLEGCPFGSDFLEIKIGPEEGFTLSLNAKAPEGKGMQPVEMKFLHESVWPYSPKAYEVILGKILAGDKFVSVSFEEIRECWKITEEIQKKNLPLKIYPQGSKGPDLS
jgi:glucose-6-phosphate 1-dehydrogenase